MDSQLALFEQPEHPIVQRLRGATVEAMTPLQALNLLAELKASLDKGTEEDE